MAARKAAVLTTDRSPTARPGNSGGGTPLMNPTSVVNTFNPYYFPWVVGSGQNVKGYFDYRPKNINEAIVEAISTNAGQTLDVPADGRTADERVPQQRSEHSK